MVFYLLGNFLGLKRKRLIVGSLFVSVFTIFSLIYPIPIFLRFFVGILFVYLAFGFYNFKQFISLSLLYYTISISVGGLTFLIDSSVNLNLLISSVVIVTVFYLIDKLIFDSKLSWKTQIQINGKKIVALIDTGNIALVDGLSICFIKSSINLDVEYSKLCSIDTISGTTVIDLYKAEIVINKSLMECYISYNDDIPYDALISPHLFKFKGEK